MDKDEFKREIIRTYQKYMYEEPKKFLEFAIEVFGEYEIIDTIEPLVRRRIESQEIEEILDFYKRCL